MPGYSIKRLEAKIKILSKIPRVISFVLAQNSAVKNRFFMQQVTKNNLLNCNQGFKNNFKFDRVRFKTEPTYIHTDENLILFSTRYIHTYDAD